MYNSADCTDQIISDSSDPDITEIDVPFNLEGMVEGEYYFSIKGEDALGTVSSCQAVAHKAVYLLDKSPPDFTTNSFSVPDGETCDLVSGQTNCSTLNLRLIQLRDMDPVKYTTPNIFLDASINLTANLYDDANCNNELSTASFPIYDGTSDRILSFAVNSVTSSLYIKLKDDVENESCIEISGVPEYIAPISDDIVLKFSETLDSYSSTFSNFDSTDGDSKKSDFGPIFSTDNTSYLSPPYLDGNLTENIATHPHVELTLQKTNGDDYQLGAGQYVQIFHNRNCSSDGNDQTPTNPTTYPSKPMDVRIPESATNGNSEGLGLLNIFVFEVATPWHGYNGERFFSAKIVSDLEPDGGNCSAVLLYNDNKSPSYLSIDMLASDSSGCALSQDKTKTNCNDAKFSISNFDDASSATVYFVKTNGSGSCLGFSDNEPDGVFDDNYDNDDPDGDPDIDIWKYLI